MPIALQKNRTRCTDISETLRNFVVQKGRHMKLVIKCGATSALDTP